MRSGGVTEPIRRLPDVATNARCPGLGFGEAGPMARGASPGLSECASANSKGTRAGASLAAGWWQAGRFVLGCREVVPLELWRQWRRWRDPLFRLKREMTVAIIWAPFTAGRDLFSPEIVTLHLAGPHPRNPRSVMVGSTAAHAQVVTSW